MARRSARAAERKADLSALAKLTPQQRANLQELKSAGIDTPEESAKLKAYASAARRRMDRSDVARNRNRQRSSYSNRRADVIQASQHPELAAEVLRSAESAAKGRAYASQAAKRDRGFAWSGTSDTARRKRAAERRLQRRKDRG